MLILTLTFGTVVAMGMPIGGAVIGLTTALGLIGLLGHLIAVPDIAHTVATMIGLAVGIDYALFLVTRHRVAAAEGIELHESIARAVGTAGTAIVFAGCTVVVALVSLVVAGIPLVSSLGYTAAVAVAPPCWPRSPCCPRSCRWPAGGSTRSRCRSGSRRPTTRRTRGSGAAGPASSSTARWCRSLLAALILVPLIIPVLTCTSARRTSARRRARRWSGAPTT